jgi:hypothetical protein
MEFRTLFFGVSLLGAVGGWFVAATPSLMFGQMKRDYIAGAESAGYDMSKCKARGPSPLDPTGMGFCAQDIYQQTQEQMRQLDEDSDSPSLGEDPPSYDESTSAD